jgi:dTMP kinase
LSRSGRFIVLEGIDGSGTTTQARRLGVALEERGHAVCLTCEPTPGPVGKLIRQALRHELLAEGGSGVRPLSWSTMALLFAADRGDHLDSVVLPALASGKTVVCDRYVLSSILYQSVTSTEGEASVPFIRALNARARRPDLTIVLDVSNEVAESRRAARGGPAEMFEVTEIQRNLALAYVRAETFVPDENVIHVSDGTPESVHLRILEAVLRESEALS